MVISHRQKEMNSRYLPIAGCVAVILVCIKIIREKAFQSQRPLPPPPSDPATVPPIPDPEVIDRPPSPTISISPSCDEPHDFDIFLSFRGEDTRNGFTGHLYQALCDRQLKTFIDSNDLLKGEQIEELLPYIERSKVFVPIISKGYAGSKWCLREIAKIVNCAQGRLMVPIFFGVEPSDVRHQTGPFKSAFKSYDKDKKMERAEVKKWRDALKTVANLSGYTLKDTDGNESTLVKKVVSRLLRHLNPGLLPVADHPVGMESRIEDVMKMLPIEEDGVKTVGIVGTGGIGKTTITKAVFNKLRSKFGAATFLPSVREYWKSPLPKTQLMRQLVEEILDDRVTPINHIESGQHLFKRGLFKKVLIVLDDLDHVDQFKVLLGEGRRGFASGSRVIITTRDESVLSQCGVKQGDVYKPKLLDNDQSLELFKRYAFETSCQQQDMYVDMSMKVVAFAGGLPLALRVFGSYLSDKRDSYEWQDYLDKLQRTSEQDIQKSLQISYDGLYDVEKRIFLDIACFFRGHSQEEATLLWESLKWQPRSAIKVLQKKSLITVRDDGAFDMHDLIADMGREVIRQAEPCKPWMWSRLWTAENTLETLNKNRRNDVVEGINLSGNGEELSSADAFGEMTSLRLLRVNNVSFKGENLMLPGALKMLFLRVTKIESLSSCNLENLVALELHVADDMSKFLVRESTSKVFNALKFLKISCHSIRTTPDFSNMPHLETLEFSYCASLVEVHESIGNLTKLKYLKFLQFLNLEKLPDAICQLTSLQTLHLIQFPRLVSLPERLGDLLSLNELELADLAITSIPSSIGQLTKLRKMYLRKLDRLRSLPDSISSLNSLQVFNIEGTDLKGLKIDGVDLMAIDQLEISSSNCLTVLPVSSLKKARALCISDSTIEELPESLEAMEKIEHLSLRCKNLKTLPDWFKNLQSFEADCESLTLIINEIWSLRSLQSLSLRCANLEELPAMAGSFIGNLKSFTLGCKNLRALPQWIGSVASLRSLKLEACENIADLPLCISNLSQLEELALNGSKRIHSVPPLPSSLLVLDASNCSDLGKTLDVSNLKSLKKLCLGGCRLLEEVQGIENSARNMEELVLPGPYGSIDCSSLSEDFKKKVFKELAFERLRRFEIWGSLAPGSVSGHQQLSSMVPNVANGIKPEPRIERLVLNNVPSPIHMKLVEEDHRVIFESTFEVQRPVVTNFYRPIWIPLPRNSFQIGQCMFISIPYDWRNSQTETHGYPGGVILVRYDVHGGAFYESIGVPCHERCARLSLKALHGSEAVVVEEEEEDADEGGEEGGGGDREIEDERDHGGENGMGAHRPKIKQVFQPNRVPYFWASYPCFIHWKHERSEISSDYEVSFGKEQEEIQEHLRAASHSTILVSTDTSNLTTIRMAFSFAGNDCCDG